MGVSGPGGPTPSTLLKGASALKEFSSAHVIAQAGPSSCASCVESGRALHQQWRLDVLCRDEWCYTCESHAAPATVQGSCSGASWWKPLEKHVTGWEAVKLPPGVNQLAGAFEGSQSSCLGILRG